MGIVEPPNEQQNQSPTLGCPLPRRTGERCEPRAMIKLWSVYFGMITIGFAIIILITLYNSVFWNMRVVLTDGTVSNLDIVNETLSVRCDPKCIGVCSSCNVTLYDEYCTISYHLCFGEARRTLFRHRQKRSCQTSRGDEYNYRFADQYNIANSVDPRPTHKNVPDIECNVGRNLTIFYLPRYPEMPEFAFRDTTRDTNTAFLLFCGWCIIISCMTTIFIVLHIKLNKIPHGGPDTEQPIPDLRVLSSELVPKSFGSSKDIELMLLNEEGIARDHVL